MQTASINQTAPRITPTVLDLREHAVLPPSVLEQYNRIAHTLRTPFNECIDGITAHFNGSTDWLFTLPASRNPLASQLFHCVTATYLAKRMQDLQTLPPTIIAHSAAHTSVLRKTLGQTIAIQHNPKSLNGTVRVFLNATYQLLRTLVVWGCARLTRKISTAATTPDILIDTFLLSGQENNERYYPGLLESLAQEDKPRVRFVPTLFGVTIRNAWRTIRGVRLSPLPCLLREDYLTFGDIIRAWIKALRGQRLTIPAAPCEGIDLAPLIREELGSFKEFGSAMAAHLVRSSFHRFRDHGLRLRTTVDWFENQAVDRGWNLGAQETFPEADHIGYQAFPLADFHLNLIPTPQEFASGIIPGTIATLGLFAGAVTAQCPKVRMISSPSFRFNHLFKARKGMAGSKEIDIFAPLPMASADALQLLEVLTRIAEQVPELVIAVRPHPATPAYVKMAASSAKGIVVPEDSFDETLARTRILLGNGSSTCLEALLKGVYVIVINTCGLLMNPIPENVPSELYHVSFSFDDVLDHVRQALQAPDQSVQEKAQALLHKCMTPVTPETVRHFLRIPDTTL